MNPDPLMLKEIAAEQQRYMVKVYMWMTGALFITGFVAMFTVASDALREFIFGGSGYVFYGLLIVELIAVMALSAMINKMSAAMATMIFIGYSILNGLTLSCIFLIFTAGSIASTFFITAGTFGAMSLYGYTTKKDLTKVGSLLTMALFGLVIASVVNLFFIRDYNGPLYWVTTFAGVIIFVGLTAYDTQKIKNMNIIGNEGTEEDQKEAIMGALTLYLDFINLFLYLLRLFGRRK